MDLNLHYWCSNTNGNECRCIDILIYIFLVLSSRSQGKIGIRENNILTTELNAVIVNINFKIVNVKNTI